ncbi:MAG: hypothetical protein CVU79_03125 [Elusimicrobia bacterium HGW-Elusimicrobia-3]|nr:MAG: hypothetical protein CVU79_03125 [Elusimicrobia bacterium HGW-Elusimicrobia-3]
MKAAAYALLIACLACSAAAAFEEEGLSETLVSTDTARGGEEEEEQALIQESDEDLAAFVADYIRKDVRLKGAFLIENKATGKVLRLELLSVDRKAAGGDNGSRAVRATFKDAAGNKYSALFWVQLGPWGGLDIHRIELGPQGGKPAGGKK